MNLPAHLQHRQSRGLTTQAIGGINSGSPAHISIGENRFTLVDEAGNEKVVPTHHVDVCVIDANASVSKIFFNPQTPYVPGGDNSNPPLCWSDNGIGASVQASEPQNTSCQLCPHNAWGSKISQQGTKVKACTDVKKVAVVVPGIDMVFLLRIPPASLKNWGKYCNTLAGHGVDLPDAITRLEFESQGILKFTPMGYVDAATAEISDKAIAGKATDALVGRNDRPWGGQGEQQKIEYAKQQGNAGIALGAAPAQPLQAPPQPFGQAQPMTPANRAAGNNAFGGEPAPASPFGQPGTSSPTDATQVGAQPGAPKRSRGPNKPKEAAPAAEEDGIPPFLRRTAGEPQPVAPVNPTQFGMQQNPPAPDAGVQAALDAAFRLPT